MNNSENELELTAYCGLYCGDCIRYKSKTADLAAGMLEELRNSCWGDYARVSSDSAFKYYERVNEVLEAIARRKCIDACRKSGGCPTLSCKIIKCCKKRGFTGCWECREFENCREFEFLTKMHGDTPKRNISIIKENGIEGWSRTRGKFYVWS